MKIGKLEKRRKDFSMDRWIDLLPIWFELNKQLHPCKLSQLATSGQCRIHGTTEHEEMHCLVFLLRVDLALRGKIYFLQLYEPIALFNSE